MNEKNLKILNTTIAELSQRIGVLTYERNALQVEAQEMAEKLKEYEKDDSK